MTATSAVSPTRRPRSEELDIEPQPEHPTREAPRAAESEPLRGVASLVTAHQGSRGTSAAARFAAVQQAAPAPAVSNAVDVSTQELDSKTEAAVCNVASTAARVGLPTSMLREVIAYDLFGDASENYTSRITDRMHLDDKTSLDASGWSELSLPGTSGAVGTVYHEAAHQYLETAESPAVKQFVQDGIRLYAAADVESRYPGVVETTDDPKSVFHEAVAGYVGHRVSVWEEARGNLEARARQGKLTPEAYNLIVEHYDEQMARRAFGYQVTPDWQVLLGEPARKDTSMRIPEQLRAFVDQVLLESRIADRFQDDPMLRSYAAKVTGPNHD